MENTDKILFEDNKAVWHVFCGDKWQGPFTLAEIHQRIQRGTYQWTMFACNRDTKKTDRLCQLKDFVSVLPSAPDAAMVAALFMDKKPEVRKAELTAAIEAPTEWFLFRDQLQSGPYSGEQINAMIQAGKLEGRVFVWRDGMDDWELVAKRKEFKQVASGSSTPVDMKIDLRQSPRKPLVARILVANDQSIITGVCRDISIGGMQILTRKIPGKTGEHIRMNVSPSGSDIQPFAAEGEIVRILEDGLGFSFRFENLGKDARQSIEKYIKG